MITVQNLTKSHGRTLVLEGLTFDVVPGKVTGFLGPNGSGKSSTIRIMLGLDKADSGVAWINGTPIRNRSRPLREVGFFLDADYVHPSRSPRTHLRALAASNCISKQRVDDVIEMVGLESVAHQRLGTFSLGMKQRVGLAAAALGDPPVMILDEPANGLDPEGAHWLRQYLTGCAAVVRSPRSTELAHALQALGAVVRFANGELEVDGWTPEQVGQVAFQHGFEIHGLWSTKASLESAFLALTAQSLLAGIADQPMDLEGALIGIHLAPLLFMIFGIQILGQEYRFNTIRNTFAASPRRASVLGAKAVVLAVVVAGVAAVLSACSILAAVLVTGARGIVRHQVAAIVTVVLWFTAVEGTLIALFDGAGRWLPLSSTFNLITVEHDAAYLSPLLAAVYSALVCVAIGAVGIARIVRADA